MIHCIVALECEARPLINRHRLARCPDSGPFPLYQGADMLLAVSGLGKIAAAAAVGYIQGRYAAATPPAWLNMGVAGHQTLAVGTPFMAHKVSDAASGQTYYPAFPFRPLCASSPLTTVDQPETQYPAPGGYDMEATGFWASANRFSTGEMVHCLKVVSDNPANPAAGLTKQTIETLCAAAMDTVDALLASLGELYAQHAVQRQDPPFLQECLEQWRFSTTQAHQLRQLLGRRQALGLTDPPWLPDPGLIATGKHLLRTLQAQCDQSPFPL